MMASKIHDRNGGYDMTHIVGGFGEIGVKWWVCALCAAVLLMRYIIVIRKLLNVNCKVAFEL